MLESQTIPGRKTILAHMGERRDPYAVSLRLDRAVDAFNSHALGLWVPAFAGTTLERWCHMQSALKPASANRSREGAPIGGMRERTGYRQRSRIRAAVSSGLQVRLSP